MARLHAGWRIRTIQAQVRWLIGDCHERTKTLLLRFLTLPNNWTPIRKRNWLQYSTAALRSADGSESRPPQRNPGASSIRGRPYP